MLRRCRLAALALLVAGCGPAVTTPSPEPSAASASPEPSAAAERLLLEPWQPEPLSVQDNVLDAIRFVCANPADTNVKAAIENLPLVLVDARGDSLVSVILADEFVAFECRLKLEMLGSTLTSTILQPPTRLDPTAIGAVEEGGLRVISHTRVDEETGSRTILIGRAGPAASRLVVGFSDQTEVEASLANGWFMAWWPGNDEPSEIVALDSQGLAQASAPEPATQIEGRVRAAAWWLDPAAAPLSPDATSIPALIQERECASGQSPEGRILDPTVFSSEAAVLVTFWVRLPAEGGGDCQANPLFPFEIPLGKPIGQRGLLDGSTIPPRDAAVPPG
jgi:hypothetical protein